MNILIAPDKFKDAASASDICVALQKGIKKTFPTAKCTLLPLADGGEGTLESIALSLNAAWQSCQTLNPLHQLLEAPYLYIADKAMAIIETARASGIELLTQEERNCLITSSVGTGILIKDAIKQGAKNIVLTVGGTATNDAGMGIASALGFRFLDEYKKTLLPIGENLHKVRYIDDSEVIFVRNSVQFSIATDVENPFFGEKGAAHVFARQKGADDEGIELLDKGLRNYAQVLENYLGVNPQNLPGSGAGGGIAGGMAALLGAKIISAADWILQLNQFEQHIIKNDILITGEGKIDSQTWGGKLLSRLLSLCTQHHIPVLAVCGTLQDVAMLENQPNVLYATSILQAPCTLSTALQETLNLVEQQGILLGKLLPHLKISPK